MDRPLLQLEELPDASDGHPNESTYALDTNRCVDLYNLGPDKLRSLQAAHDQPLHSVLCLLDPRRPRRRQREDGDGAARLPPLFAFLYTAMYAWPKWPRLGVCVWAWVVVGFPLLLAVYGIIHLARGERGEGGAQLLQVLVCGAIAVVYHHISRMLSALQPARVQADGDATSRAAPAPWKRHTPALALSLRVPPLTWPDLAGSPFYKRAVNRLRGLPTWSVFAVVLLLVAGFFGAMVVAYNHAVEQGMPGWVGVPMFLASAVVGAPLFASVATHLWLVMLASGIACVEVEHLDARLMGLLGYGSRDSDSGAGNHLADALRCVYAAEASLEQMSRTFQLPSVVVLAWCLVGGLSVLVTFLFNAPSSTVTAALYVLFSLGSVLVATLLLLALSFVALCADALRDKLFSAMLPPGSRWSEFELETLRNVVKHKRLGVYLFDLRVESRLVVRALLPFLGAAAAGVLQYTVQ